MRGLVGFLTKTIQKMAKIEKVASIYLLGFVSCQIFCMCKHLERANFWWMQNLGRAKLVGLASLWSWKIFGTWFKIWDVQKFWRVQKPLQFCATTQFGALHLHDKQY